LRKQEWLVPATVGFGEHQLVPLRASEMVKWKLME
jgi:dihydroorotase